MCPLSQGLRSSRRFLFMVVVSALAFSAQASAAPIVVDTFDTPVAASTVTSGSLTGAFPSESGLGILGTRDLSYTGTNATTGNTFDSFEGISVGAGFLKVGTFTSALEIQLDYSGFGTKDVSGANSLDLTFVPVFDLGVGGGFDVNVELTTTTGLLNATMVPPVGFAPSGGTLSIPLASFTGPGSFSGVQGIQINLNNGGSPNTSSDFSLTQIQFSEIPEPATVTLFALCCIGAAIYGRRRLQGFEK